MRFVEKFLENILREVERPARYIGAELNSVQKSWLDIKLKVALAYPDLYEIGMSNLGLQILYALINQQPDYLCERFFSPAEDLRKILVEKKIPLFSLESQKDLKEFDLVGFSVQTELSYTNILSILETAQIPLYSSERTANEKFPLIFAGGSVSVNPEPMADFFDFFVLGEAEEVILEVLAVVAKNKGRPKIEILKELAKIDGIYVPSFYEVKYLGDGKIAEIKPLFKEAKFPVKKRVLANFDKFPILTKPIVPYLEAVHDRANLEIMRGCPNACRFCQAGFIYRPVRFKDRVVLIDSVRELVKNTGFNEVSLLSLSSCDYPGIESLADELSRMLEPQKISLALPSIRVDKFNIQIGRSAQMVRKTGVTLVPEAGSERLRQVIRKNITEAEILAAAETALRLGMQKLKLYFMIGLPTETEEDLQALVDLVYKIMAVAKKYRFSQLNISVNTFVPKPQTPFQWAPFLSEAEVRQKQEFLRKNLRHSKIKLQLSDWPQSIFEAILARGDRRLSAAVAAAYRAGARMDAWREYFKWPVWQKAFADCGLDLDFYTTRVRDTDEILPWGHLNYGVSKDLLKSEWVKAMAEPEAAQ